MFVLLGYLPDMEPLLAIWRPPEKKGTYALSLVPGTCSESFEFMTLDLG